MANVDLGKTQITDLIRVSSAAIYYECWPFNYWQYETFIFSNDDNVKTKQVIHGTSGQDGSHKLECETKKVHKYIADNLLKHHVNI